LWVDKPEYLLNADACRSTLGSTDIKRLETVNGLAQNFQYTNLYRTTPVSENHGKYLILRLFHHH
jgi:hypothetical protein